MLTGTVILFGHSSEANHVPQLVGYYIYPNSTDSNLGRSPVSGLLTSFLGNKDIYLIGTGFSEQGIVSAEHLVLSVPSDHSPEHNSNVYLIYVGLNNSGDPTQEHGSHNFSSELPIAPRMVTTQQRDLSEILNIKHLGDRTDSDREDV
ncbi:hypothetical protein B0H14DRAFT_2623228 [Mycena olivaceomarginata]|nr:hypothetical protein B0H14DRAFT_2623228 [Mycena olivaceomarginata]